MSDEVLETPLEAASAEQYVPEILIPEGPDSGQPVVVYTASSAEDGEIVRGLLESENIPVILTTSASPVLGEVFAVGEGQGGEILVAPSDADLALAILSESIPDAPGE